MSEKQFECVFVEDEFGGTYRRLKDNKTGIVHMTCDVADLLNFQNTQIKCLKEENEQLKEAKYEYKQDWKQASVNCDLYKQEISFLKEEMKGFEEENEQLRKENVFLAKQRSYWKGKSDMAVETFEIDEATVKQIRKLEKENEQLQTELNNYEKITNLLADYDVHHYNRWINQIKNYVEKTNKDFEYNREFIIKLCLSYTLQSLRNGEDLKRFQWGMVNDN